MQVDQIKAKFDAIGARARCGIQAARRFERNPSPLVLDVKEDRRGEFFDIRVRPDQALDFIVMASRPAERHLLLGAKGWERNAEGGVQEFPHGYSCGHDERLWFVAAVLGGSNVDHAKEALNPRQVQENQRELAVGARLLHERKTAAFVRQGEWFFVPCPDLIADERLVLRNEPFRRGGFGNRRGKAHMVEFLYRRGGTQVRVCNSYAGKRYWDGARQQNRR